MIHTDGVRTIANAPCTHTAGIYTDLRGNTRCKACKEILSKEETV